MIKIQKLLFLFLIALTLFSCEEDETTPFSVIGDVYVINRMENEDIIFAQAYWTYGTQAMQSVIVTSPLGNEITPEPISNVQNIYSLEPTIDDFSSEIPEEGDYIFEVVNEGITHQTTDFVDFSVLDIPIIDTAYYVPMRDAVVVQWTPDGSSEKYVVKLTDLDGNLIYAGNLLGSSQSIFEIERNTGSWFSYVQPGNTYVIELHGILYEPTATNEDFLYNIQEISVGVSDIEWGE